MSLDKRSDTSKSFSLKTGSLLCSTLFENGESYKLIVLILEKLTETASLDLFAKTRQRELDLTK